MSNGRLRVHTPCMTAAVETFPSQMETVTVALGDVLPQLADAYQGRRGWIDDFANDPITISTDLYEILLAYQHYRQTSD